MTIARAYNAGRCTQAAVAAELGVSVRRAQRIEEQAIAVLALAVCRNLRPLVGMGPLSPREIPRRFRDRISEGLADDGFDTAPAVWRSPRLWSRPARCRSLEEPMKLTTKIPTTTTSAALVAELEATPLADPVDDVIAKATAAIGADAADALAVVFDDRIPAFGADDAARYTGLTARLTAPRYPDQCAALADRARRSGLDMLFRMFLSRECLQDVEASGEAIAQPVNERESIGEARARAAAAARSKYERLICVLLADDTGAIGDAARQLLAADRLAARVAADVKRREDHARQVADQVERDRIATAAAADAAGDAAEVKRRLVEAARAHGLPPSVVETAGPWVDQQRARFEVLVKLQRRLRSTHVNAVRVALRSGPGLFGVEDLARTISESPLQELHAVLAALDAAEAKRQ